MTEQPPAAPSALPRPSSAASAASASSGASPSGSSPSPAAASFPSPVRIIGTGLIGGSLGLALSGAGVDVQIQDSSPGTESLAVEMGAGHRPGATDAAPELVIIAAPPDVAARLVVEALAAFPDATVCDVASVKATVLSAVRRAAADPAAAISESDLARYVGAHPMAGREVSGVIAARGDLFLARPFVVVPHATSRAESTALVRRLGSEIGSVPLVMDAVDHDLSVAHVSHAPQVVASLLGASLASAPERSLELAGQGLRDTSRIAASDPRLWMEILSANAAAVSPILQEMRDRLDEVLAGLASHTGEDDPAQGSRRAVAQLIADGNIGVRRIPGRHGGAAEHFATITVLVPDRPGELGRLFTEIGETGVNLEDLALEHTFGQKVGIAHVSVQRGSEGLLTQALRERGWTVAEG